MAGLAPYANIRALAEAPGGTNSGKDKTPQPQLLIELAADGLFFRTREGELYASIPVNGHKETWPLRGRALRSWLAHRFYQRFRKAPCTQALGEALTVLEARARYEGAEYRVDIRVAEYGANVYLDLANKEWTVVEITPQGWALRHEAPARFLRARGVLDLPTPDPSGTVEALRPFVNTASEDDWKLIVAWLLGTLRGVGPYPVLVLQGEQGSAKSTVARMLRMLVDPTSAPLRALPRDERDLMIHAMHAHILAFDNLSGIPGWLSDALCRLATGGGLATRELYTDSDETIFAAQRPVILNGIDDLATRQDLIDRAVVVTLPPIPDHGRRTEGELWREFERAHSSILGGLLRVVSESLRNRGSVRLSDPPRMADFALWVTAGTPALGWSAHEFLSAYGGNRSEAVELGLEANSVAYHVRRHVLDKAAWTGTAAELLSELNSIVEEELRGSRDWPRSPKALANQLRRLAPALRLVGVEVEFGRRESQTGRRLITIKKRPEGPVRMVTTVTTVTGLEPGSDRPAEDLEIASCITAISRGEPSPKSESGSRLPGDGSDDGDDISEEHGEADSSLARSGSPPSPSHGFPAEIPGYGRMRLSEPMRCQRCETLTRMRYGEHALCSDHAREEARNKSQGRG